VWRFHFSSNIPEDASGYALFHILGRDEKGQEANSLPI